MVLCTVFSVSDGKCIYLVTTDADHFTNRHGKGSSNVCLFIRKLSNMKRFSVETWLDRNTLHNVNTAFMEGRDAGSPCVPIVTRAREKEPFTKVLQTSSEPQADATQGQKMLS